MHRTYSQISQIISEYRNCPNEFIEFAQANKIEMTILGARKQYCIRDDVLESSNPNESCLELLEHNKCSFKSQADNLEEKNRIWDIDVNVVLYPTQPMKPMEDGKHHKNHLVMSWQLFYLKALFFFFNSYIQWYLFLKRGIQNYERIYNNILSCFRFLNHHIFNYSHC